jgi:hypothetical protein
MRLPKSAALLVFASLALAGCIDSSGPILSDSQQAFGPKLRLQLYALHDGFAQDPEQAVFTWNGALYEHAGGALREVAAFSVHPFEGGDYIIQEVPRKRPRIAEYALLHKIADGVYLVQAIDEADADEPTRASMCGKGDAKDPSPCRIATREQLFAFARATAARRKQDGGLALLLPAETEQARKPRARHRR